MRLLVVDLSESSHLLSDLSVRQEGAKRGIVFYFVLDASSVPGRTRRRAEIRLPQSSAEDVKPTEGV